MTELAEDVVVVVGRRRRRRQHRLALVSLLFARLLQQLFFHLFQFLRMLATFHAPTVVNQFDPKVQK